MRRLSCFNQSVVWTFLRQISVTMVFAISGLATPSISKAQAVSDSKEPIHIGVIVGDTGAYAFAGVVSHAAMAVAMEHINADGGLNGRPLILDFQDDGGQTPQALTLLGKYSADKKYVAVIGPTSSPQSFALSPVANQLKIPLLGATVISSKFLSSGEWTFKTAADPSSLMKKLADDVVKVRKISRVAIVYGRENDAQVAQKLALSDALKAHGVEVVADIGVLNADTNFSGAAQKVVVSKPDAIFVALTADATANVIVQAHAAGLNKAVTILGTSQSVSDRYLSIGGADIEGTIAGTDYDPTFPSDVNRRFAKDYAAKSGKAPDSYAALGYQAILILKKAISSIHAPVTRENLKQAMLGIKEIDGILGTGHCVFIDRVPFYGAAVLRIENKKFLPLN